MQAAIYPGLGRGRQALTGTTAVDGSYVGLILDCAGTFAANFAASATLGTQFQAAFYCTSGAVTLTANGAETIQSPAGSANTFILSPGQGCWVSCDGTGLKITLGTGLAPSPTTPITVYDNAFSILDNVDPTKIAQFQCSGISAGTTRTFTFPNANTTLAGYAVAGTWTAAQNFGAPVTVALGTIASGVAVDATATWNSGATTFGGFRFTVTNTASSADSKLIDLVQGSTPQFSVLRDGAMIFTSSATAWPSSTYDTAGVILRTAGGGSAPFDQAGSLLYRSRLSDTAGRSSHVFYTGAAATERFRINETGVLLIADAGNVSVGTTTGTKFATATTQKMGWWNATPVVQPTAVADASGGATTDAEARTALNELLARLRTVGLIAT